MKKTENNQPLRGETLLKTAVNQILNHPSTWYQGSWHTGDCQNGCHTVHCIGGWIQILGGNRENADSVVGDVRDFLGIALTEARWLCAADRSLIEIYFFTKRFSDAGFDRDGFDRDGFDRAGFDRAGFDHAGFDRDGFDRAGFDRAGLDRDGRDRDGFDHAGFDRAGFDRAGRDRAGRDRDGFDRAGFDRAGRDRDGRGRDGNKLTPFEL